MGKKFSGVSQTMSRFRGWIQAGATLLTNLHLPNFLKGGLYQGAGKTVCVPGLNCYSCPAASGACPIGAFQAVVGSSKFSFSYYITGFLILLGVLLGRFICGFLCPFGWFQELLHKIPTKKLSTKRLKPLTYLKYAVLLVMVFLLPAFLVNDVGMGDPFFCKYLCPQGVLEGAIPLSLANSGIRAALARLAPAGALKQPPLVHDLLPEHGTLLLVVPLDSGAPQGRLILPQVQTIRDSLDGRCLCLVVTEEQLPQAFAALREPPDLVVCDSQVVHLAARELPSSIPLTTFSLLMARARGNMTQLAQGAAALSHLRPGDFVLLREGCSHHPQKDDIGRVKLPRLLEKIAGGPVKTRMLAGKNAEADEDPAPVLAIHCGACTLTRRQMLRRQRDAQRRGIPMTNYGMAISFAQGVLGRVLSPFPDALRAFNEALEKSRT